MNKKLENLQEKVNAALKGGDTSNYHTLKFLLSKMQNAEIEARGKGRELADDDFDRVVLKEVKSHEESINAYRQGGRQDLVDKESKELELLRSLAPQMMSEEEIKAVVEAKYQSLSAVGPVEFGRLMGEVMRELKGKAEGEVVKKVVFTVIASKAKQSR